MSKNLLTSSMNCSKHNEEFKLYCQEDNVPVCIICIVAGRHKAHSVVTLNEMLKHAKLRHYLFGGKYIVWLTLIYTIFRIGMIERKLSTRRRFTNLLKYSLKYWAHMTQALPGPALKSPAAPTMSMLESLAGDLQRHMLLIQNNIKYIANNIVEVNTSTSRLQKQLSQKYRDMITTLKRVEDETMSIVKAEQMKIISSLNESIGNSEKEAQEIESVIEQISFLCKGGDMYQIMQDKQDIFTRAQVMLKKSSQIPVTIKLEDNFLHLTEAANKLESRLVEFLLQKWARNITLDVETSHPTLEITDNGKAVSVREDPLDVPLSPRRFAQVTAVLASEGFNTGKHYWEVTVQDKSDWSVGIVKESMPRGGNSNLMNSPLAWSVAFQQTLYLAWHNNISTPLQVTQLQRLGVFLDYEVGQLAFYDASTMTPLHMFSESFTETLYPAFNPGRSKDKMRKAILILQDVGSV